MYGSSTVYFTQEEQIIIMNSYEEFKNQITDRATQLYIIRLGRRAGKKLQIV